VKFKDTKYGDLSGQDYKGDISVIGMQLTSLEGAPKTVNGYFYCSENMLFSLKGAPKNITSNFDCSKNKLKTLEDGPEEVKSFYFCNYNKLISLKGIAKRVGGLFCMGNNIKTFQYFPDVINGPFNCQNNAKLTQEDIYELLKYDIRDEIIIPKKLKMITKEDYKLYKKIGWSKFIKLKKITDNI